MFVTNSVESSVRARLRAFAQCARAFACICVCVCVCVYGGCSGEIQYSIVILFPNNLQTMNTLIVTGRIYVLLSIQLVFQILSTHSAQDLRLNLLPSFEFHYVRFEIIRGLRAHLLLFFFERKNM